MRFDISCIKNSCPFLFSFHLGYCTLLIYDSWVTTTVSHPPWPGPAHPVPTPGWWQLESNGHNVTYILVVTNVYIEIYRLFHCFSQFFLGMTSVTNIIEPCQFIFTCTLHLSQCNNGALSKIYFLSDDITYNHRQSQKTRNHFSSTHKPIQHNHR